MRTNHLLYRISPRRYDCPPAGIKTVGGECLYSHARATHESPPSVNDETESLPQNLEIETVPPETPRGHEGEENQQLRVVVPSYIAGPEAPRLPPIPRSKYDPAKVGEVSETTLDIWKMPIESLLSEVEIKAETKVKRRMSECLTPGDLRAWFQTWDLSVEEAARLLRHTPSYTWKWLQASNTFLPWHLSRRLVSLRWKNRHKALARMPKDSSHLKEKADGKVQMFLYAVKGRAFMRDAYVHGLDVRDLEYWRLPEIAWNRDVRQQACHDPWHGCRIVHSPSGLSASSALPKSFAHNRAFAEGLLAKKVAKWAGEPPAGRREPDKVYPVGAITPRRRRG